MQKGSKDQCLPHTNKRERGGDRGGDRGRERGRARERTNEREREERDAAPSKRAPVLEALR